MIQTFASKLFNWRWAMPIVLGLGAAAGWSMFVASGHSAAETERQLREQIVDLQASQTRLVSERDQLQSAATETAQLRKQLRMAQDEAVRLVQERRPAQPPLSANPPAARPPQNSSAQASSTSSMPPPPPRPPARPAGSALVKPKPGVLVAETGLGDGKR
jgi:uncharacterized protein YlxW (UPF0749 family)